MSVSAGLGVGGTAVLGLSLSRALEEPARLSTQGVAGAQTLPVTGASHVMLLLWIAMVMMMAGFLLLGYCRRQVPVHAAPPGSGPNKPAAS